MAITIYNNSPELGSDENRVVAVCVEHWDTKCPHNKTKDYHTVTKHTELTPECGTRCQVGYSHISYEGLVVGDREMNGYDDSDFYAKVIVNVETLETKEICYATTRGWTYNNGCRIDAPEELMTRYNAKLIADAEASRVARKARQDAAEAQIPYKGRRVRVVSKRSKVPEGTEGEVVYFARSQYARPRRYYGPTMASTAETMVRELSDYRIGIKNAEGVHWCSASTVTVL